MKSIGITRFGPLTPDQPDFGHQGVEVARNVIPIANGYQPLATPGMYSSAIDSRALGAISVKDDAGNSYNYTGDANKLYWLQGTAWSDVSSAPYSASTTRWDFTEYLDQIIGTNYFDDPQTITLGGPIFASLTNLFKSRTVATIRNFVVHGNTTDLTDGDRPTRVRWSARGDPNDYVPSSTTLAGFQDLDSAGGPIRKIISGEYGLIFQERTITRMSFRGDAAVWQFDPVEPQIGTRSPDSVVRWGYDTYFLAEDGFRVFRGSSSTPNAEESIDRTFLSDLDEAFIDRVSGALDPAQHLIYWAYPGGGNTGGVSNKMMIFNPSIGRWSTGDGVNIDLLFQSASPFIDLDTDAGPEDIPLDVSGSFDDKIWQGGNFQIAAMLGDGAGLGYFNAASGQAELSTSEQQIEQGHRAVVRYIRPIVDGGDCQIAIGYRNTQRDPVVWTDLIQQDSSGRAKFRVKARYLRSRVLINGPWSDAVGIEPTVRIAGRR